MCDIIMYKKGGFLTLIFEKAFWYNISKKKLIIIGKSYEIFF